MAVESRSSQAPGDGTYAAFLGRRHFAGLDGLRAVSIVAVIWHHTAASEFPEGILRQGFLGVHLFFAISGFLITSLLIRERVATGRIRLRNFYVRRTLRIFPLYYAVLLIYVVLTLTLRRGTQAGQQFMENLPAFATYTSNWFVDLSQGETVTFYFAWSLATEEQFYLVWPPLLVVLSLIGRRRGLLPAVGLAILATISVVGLHYVRALDDPNLPWRIAASIQIPILSGAALALLLHKSWGFDLLRPFLARRHSAIIVGGVLLAAIAADVHVQVVGVIMALLVASTCMRDRGVGYAVLGSWPLVSAGKVSYGMYLMHMLVANAFMMAGVRRGMALFILTTVGVFLLAQVAFQFFESPILALKKRFEWRRH